jgi:aromatic-L-amino-acid decarboxylase
MLDWLAQMIGLPRSFMSASPGEADEAGDAGAGSGEPERGGGSGGGGGGGVIQGTASEAALTAIVAARHAAIERLKADGRYDPVRPPAFSVYCSNEAHSSIVKSAAVAGIDRAHARTVPTDDALAMDPAALDRMIDADRTQGLVPIFVCATLGTTSTGAFDPLPAVGEVARRHGLWLHVDAAWAGAAFVCPEFRGSLAGIHHADSLSFNPHKWLLTNFDCSAFWINGRERREQLIASMAINPEYLKNRGTDAGATDFRDWHVPLGRRFRALKLWFVIRHYGVEGLRAHIRQHVAWTERLEQVIAQDDRFELMTPRSLSLLCFRARPPAEDANANANAEIESDAADAFNAALLEKANASGEMLLTQTRIRGRYAIRFNIGGTWTTLADVQRAWRRITELRDQLRDELHDELHDEPGNESAAERTSSDETPLDGPPAR